MSEPKVALIVGAGPGLGGSQCRRFAREGYTIAPVRRRHSEELQDLCKEIAEQGGVAHGFECDLRSQEQVIALTCLAIHQQPRSAWTFEADVRPWLESW